MFCLFVLSFGNESLCASGCGNLMEPVFTWAHAAFGAWGVRCLFLLLAALFARGALSTRS
jgi:hypothetical protein